MDTPIGELEPGTGHQVPNGARHKDLARRGYGEDALADMNGQAARCAVRELEFSRMESGPDLEAERAESIAYGESAAHRTCRPIERGEFRLRSGCCHRAKQTNCDA